jgi:hypothetical protein
MGDVPPSHDAVRAYLDSAVADAAERWVGRATDATAYADLVAAVLARREALSPMLHLPERVFAEPPPVQPRSRHNERRARPRWPLGGGPISSPGDREQPFVVAPVVAPQAPSPAPAQAAGPGQPTLDVRGGAALPSRPPGRHRTPAQVVDGPHAIDLNQNLSTVLDWLGHPEH